MLRAFPFVISTVSELGSLRFPKRFICNKAFKKMHLTLFIWLWHRHILSKDEKASSWSGEAHTRSFSVWLNLLCNWREEESTVHTLSQAVLCLEGGASLRTTGCLCNTSGVYPLDTITHVYPAVPIKNILDLVLCRATTLEALLSLHAQRWMNTLPRSLMKEQRKHHFRVVSFFISDSCFPSLPPPSLFPFFC